MEEKLITCVTCPVGCEITVRAENGKILSMEGHTCKRGEEYAENEFFHPVRILASIIKVEDGDTPLVAVRTSAPLPKDTVMECMGVIRKARTKAPVVCGTVLIADILGTGVDVIATGSVKPQGEANG